MLDEAASEPEILTDDDGHVEEWRPVKKWKFVDGTWKDVFADLFDDNLFNNNDQGGITAVSAGRTGGAAAVERVNEDQTD